MCCFAVELTKPDLKRLETMFLQNLILIVFVVEAVCGNAGQGMGDGTELQSDEIVEAVKQEVFLKTAGAEPPELGGNVKTYSDIGRGVIPRHEGNTRHHGSKNGHRGETGHRRHNHHNQIGDGVHVGTEIGYGSNVIGVNRDVEIGQGSQPHPRFPRLSEFKPFDSGYQKECNSYYGRSICYRIFTNSHFVPPPEYTCWNIGQRKRNCTEIDNVLYLKRQGVKSWDTEIPDSQSSRRTSGFQSTRRESSPNYDNVLQGSDKYYDPYRPTGTFGQTGNYNENILNRESELGGRIFQFESISLDTKFIDEVSLVRMTRKYRRSSGIVRRDSGEYNHEYGKPNLVNKPKPDGTEYST